jgi:hypothetical protein
LDIISSCLYEWIYEWIYIEWIYDEWMEWAGNGEEPVMLSLRGKMD